MSATIPGHTPKEPLTLAAYSGGAGAWQPSARADPSRESLKAGGADLAESFYDSLEEESSQSLSDSLNSRKHSSAAAGGSALPHNSFSDSLKDSGDESDVSDTLDSDTGSFYSVQSYRRSGVNDSVASLLTSEFHSESTLYDSAPSVQANLASSRSSILSFASSSRDNNPNTLKHRSSLSFQPGYPEQLSVRRDSESSWEYTSCPDLSTAGYRGSKELLQNPTKLGPVLTSQPISNSLCGRRSPRLSPSRKRSVTSGSMSAVAGSASPKQHEEVDKKKKGLMSSFRKSRKTGRKLRQQKKASESDVASTGSGATIDGDQELLFDSDLSAPNSPALLKNEVVDAYQGDKKAEGTGVLLDSHQATHERLNGSTSPKGSAPSTPSPVLAKSGKTEETPKETEEKEEKKKEKSKFGSLLLRKDKKHKAESASKSSIMSNASASSSVTTDDSIVSGNAVAASDSSEVATGEKGDGGKDDSDPLTAAAGPANTEDSTPRPTPSQSPSFRSYISNVQFVKNFTVNAETPKVKSTSEAEPKVYVHSPEGEVADAKTAPEETTSTIETRKTTTVSSNGRPTTTEVTSKRRTTVTIVSKPKDSPKVKQSASPAATVRRIKALASPAAASPPGAPPARATTASPTSNSSSRSRSPTPVLPKRLSLENVIIPITKSSAADRGVAGAAPRHNPPPLTITPPEDDTEHPQKASEGSVHATSAAGLAGAPVRATPPSSPEGHGRETPEGDRSEGEYDPLVDSSILTSGSWTIASTDKREHLYKILVIGELGTGKTSIIKRYVHQFFSQHYRATIGVDFALKVLNWDSNTVIRLQLWDIAGQERFGNMTRVYYKEAVGAFVVFDVTRAQTFDAVAKWKTDLDTKVTLADGSPIPAVLLANKCDQPKEGVVNNPARMDDYCRERGFSGWFETSAKENINIDEASRFLVNKILSNEKQGMMMTESMDTDKFSVDGKTNPVEKSGCRC